MTTRDYETHYGSVAKLVTRLKTGNATDADWKLIRKSCHQDVRRQYPISPEKMNLLTEDILSNVILKSCLTIDQKVHTLKETASLFGWIRTIALWTAHNAYRQAVRRLKQEKELVHDAVASYHQVTSRFCIFAHAGANTLESIDAEDGISKIAVASELKALIVAAKLTATEQKAFIAVRWEGDTAQAAARRFNTTPNAIRQATSGAATKLKVAYKQEYAKCG